MRAALFLTLCLAGCVAGVGELRDRPADLTAHVAGSFEAIAKCMANRVDELDLGGFGISEPLLRFDAKTARLFRVFSNTGGAMWDVTFTQEAPGRVLVEGRGMPTLGGRDVTLKPVWAVLPRCAPL